MRNTQEPDTTTTVEDCLCCGLQVITETCMETGKSDSTYLLFIEEVPMVLDAHNWVREHHLGCPSYASTVKTLHWTKASYWNLIQCD